MTARRDAEIDALQTLDCFVEKYGDGQHTVSIVRNALIELAARAMLGAAGLMLVSWFSSWILRH